MFVDRTDAGRIGKARGNRKGESLKPLAVAGFRGGEGGIRTHVTLPSN